MNKIGATAPTMGYKTLDELSREELLRALANLDQRVEADNEEDPYSLLARGLLHSKLGDDRRAVEDFSRVIELEPDNAEALENRAAALDDLGEHRLAREDYHAVIRLEPDNAVALYSRGACLAKQGDLTGAVADFDRAIALEPGDAVPYYNRGCHLRRDGPPAPGAGGLRPGHRSRPRKPYLPPLPGHGPPGTGGVRPGRQRL